MAGVLSKELGARLLEVERRLDNIAERLAHIDGGLVETKRQAQAAADMAQACQSRMAESNGDGRRDGNADRIEELATAVSRLDERVEKIASTLIAQSSRWT